VPGYADSLRVTVTPPSGVTLPGGFANPFILTRSSTSKSLKNLPPSADPYQFSMEALTSNTVVGTATRSIVVDAGKVREIDVSANLTPKITGIVVEGVASLNAGQSTQYTAHAVDQNNVTLFSGAGFTWTSSATGVLNVNQDSGSATASLLGNVTVSATLKGTVMTGTKNITVNSNGAVSVSIFPTSAAVQTGGSKQFNATVSGAGNTAVVWTITPVASAGSVSGSGLYSASNNAGLYFVQATSVADPSAKAEAVVSVAAPGSQYRIVYTSTFDLNPNIWMTDLLGTTYTRITDDSNDEQYPSLSPDGTRVAFSRRDDPNQTTYNIWIKNLTTNAETKLTSYSDAGTKATASKPAWSADSQFVYYAATTYADISNPDTAIHKIKSDGTGDVTLINGSNQADYAPLISPDGTKMLFQSDRGAPGTRRWYIANSDGSNITPVPNSDTSSGPSIASWSPTESKFAIVCNVGNLVNIYDKSSLSIVDHIDLTNPYSPSSFCYSPDGQSFYFGFTYQLYGGVQLYVMNISTRRLHGVTDRLGDFIDAQIGHVN